MRHADTLFYNGPVMTMTKSAPLLPKGFLAVKDGHILSLGALERETLQQWSATETVDLDGDLLMPGLINGHNHAAMTLFRGLADDLPLMAWLQDYIFPVEQKLCFDWVYWGTKLACLEMIASGTTAFADMYLFEEATAQAVDESGMRAVLGEVLYDFPSPNYGPPEKGLQYTRELAVKWRNHDRIKIAVEPHAPYTCSIPLLQSCRELAEELGLPLITHLAETAHEVQEIQSKYGMTPVQYLQKAGLLQSNLRAAHVVHVEPWEMDLLADAGVMVIHVPESNMKLGSGVAPVLGLRERGITVGLGTDGCASNNNLDMLQEMDSAAKLHKVFAGEPTAMPAAEMVKMATVHGARLLGLEQSIGTLESGKCADLIVLDFQQPHLTPVYDYFSHLVYAARGADVISTMIAGNWCMRNRHFVDTDSDEIYMQIRKIADSIAAEVK